MIRLSPEHETICNAWSMLLMMTSMLAPESPWTISKEQQGYDEFEEDGHKFILELLRRMHRDPANEGLQSKDTRKSSATSNVVMNLATGILSKRYLLVLPESDHRPVRCLFWHRVNQGHIH
jgi:hypothetical protein